MTYQTYCFLTNNNYNYSILPWHRHQDDSSQHSHNPRTQYHAAHHCTPQDHQSHPEKRERRPQVIIKFVSGKIFVTTIFLVMLYLARVLSSLQVSGTEHGAGDHARVGVVTVTVRQDGDLQTLKLVGIGSYKEMNKTTTERELTQVL